MSPNYRTKVRDSFKDGSWTEHTPLTIVPAIGSYIESRLRRALYRNHTRPLTIGEFVKGMRGLGSKRITQILNRALQNKRANQCVSPNTATTRDERTYHTGDVNEHGYEVLATILDYARQQRLFAAGLRFQDPLPRHKRRSAASRNCGCRARTKCNGQCTYVSKMCVPRDNRARGFHGSAYHPDQSVSAATDDDRRRIDNLARTNVTASIRQDADSSADVSAAHSLKMQYIRRGQKMWRRPGSKVRLPITRRS